ncbi:hypothetical protein [Parvularcula sp. LCG005]|uniref:hypothetical protein n=1 Tax=Parvularcula sp. LCG005 TaxID=3078805 RepID=UPI0029421393|nr:hypothetical protein [Parvularcula sp. LCG005]WOI54311.1 hypothetical protein RUI03_04745 [Parvularcula sp. LCG005]
MSLFSKPEPPDVNVEVPEAANPTDPTIRMTAAQARASRERRGRGSTVLTRGVQSRTRSASGSAAIRPRTPASFKGRQALAGELGGGRVTTRSRTLLTAGY